MYKFLNDFLVTGTDVEQACLPDYVIIDKCYRAETGELFKQYYDYTKWTEFSASKEKRIADYKLCELIAEYTQDAEQIERILVSSALHDRMLNNKVYRSKLIAEVLENIKRDNWLSIGC